MSPSLENRTGGVIVTTHSKYYISISHYYIAVPRGLKLTVEQHLT